jgi:hypothetical protein
MHTMVTLVTDSELNSQEVRTQDATHVELYFEGNTPCRPDNTHEYLYSVGHNRKRDADVELFMSSGVRVWSTFTLQAQVPLSPEY